jgi:hypothetical protein
MIKQITTLTVATLLVSAASTFYVSSAAAGTIQINGTTHRCVAYTNKGACLPEIKHVTARIPPVAQPVQPSAGRQKMDKTRKAMDYAAPVMDGSDGRLGAFFKAWGKVGNIANPAVDALDLGAALYDTLTKEQNRQQRLQKAFDMVDDHHK